MRTILLDILLGLCVVNSVAASEQTAQPQSTNVSSSHYECGTIAGSTAENECIDRRIKELDVEMNRVFKAALSRLPKQSSQDSRKEQKQLHLSQLAWLKYKNENCALLGGLEGKSSQNITFNALLCMEHESRERIKFLNGIANAQAKP